MVYTDRYRTEGRNPKDFWLTSFRGTERDMLLEAAAIMRLHTLARNFFPSYEEDERVKETILYNAMSNFKMQGKWFIQSSLVALLLFSQFER